MRQPEPTDVTLIAHGIHTAVSMKRPVQFHVGFGNRDLDLHKTKGASGECRTVFYDSDNGRVVTAYDNMWFLRSDDSGRCSEFHQWHAGRPEDEPDRAVHER